MSTWRQWIYAQLTGTPELTAIVPADRVKAAGSLTGSPPSHPFVLYRIGGQVPRINAADRPFIADQDAQVWVYDEPGSYNRIESYLDWLRRELPGQVVAVEGAHACVWQGTSGELADDEFKSAVKFATFKFVGGLQ
jgi:hypothetical protein